MAGIFPCRPANCRKAVDFGKPSKPDSWVQGSLPGLHAKHNPERNTDRYRLWWGVHGALYGVSHKRDPDIDRSMDRSINVPITAIYNHLATCAACLHYTDKLIIYRIYINRYQYKYILCSIVIVIDRIRAQSAKCKMHFYDIWFQHDRTKREIFNCLLIATIPILILKNWLRSY